MRTLAVILLLCSMALAGTRAPLPEKLVNAKTVYLDNRTYAEVGDKVYDELQKWGRFQLSADPKDADLIFQLTSDAEGQVTHLTVIDPTNRVAIYALSRDWGRFKSASRELVRDLKKRMK